MTLRMQVAAIQMNSGADKEKNFQKAKFLLGLAIKNKANFIVFPEVFLFRGPGKEAIKAAESPQSILVAEFKRIAKDHKVGILLGSLLIKKPGSSKVFNRCLYLNERGEIKSEYSKIHLFDVSLGSKKIQESRYMSPGKKPVLAHWRGLKVGLSVCYDLRFPELYRIYAQLGAEIICAPSSFTYATGQAHWETLVRARAIENLCYVVAPNQWGDNGEGTESFGNSLIVDPWGRVLARAQAKGDRVIYADLDLKFLRERRKAFPVLKHVKLKELG